MAAGTATLLLPVRSIERRSTGEKFVFRDGRQGPESCYSRLYERVRSIQQGKVEDPFGWTEVVREPPGGEGVLRL